MASSQHQGSGDVPTSKAYLHNRRQRFWLLTNNTIKSISVNLRKLKRDVSFEMVIDPFLFSKDFTNVVAISGALIDTGATRSSIGLDLVKELHLTSKRKEIVSTTVGLAECELFDIVLAITPDFFLNLEVYGVPNPERGSVIIGMDVIGQGTMHIEKVSCNMHRGYLSFPIPD